MAVGFFILFYPFLFGRWYFILCAFCTSSVIQESFGYLFIFESNPHLFYFLCV